MSFRFRPFMFAAATASVSLLGASTSFAETNPCGNIEITAIGECHFEFKGGCTAKCEPLNFVASCDGECNFEIDGNCTNTCTGSCSTDCSNVEPGSFDCSASCEADCKVSAQGSCSSGDSECVAYAEAQCSSECSASCEGTPPTADCTAQCNACCSGSCEVEANFDCNIDCTAELQGGCETQCQAPEGALFCDGQYLNVTDIPACVQYLVDNFEIEVEFEAEVSGSVTSDCTVADAGARKSTGALGMMAVALGLAVARLRSRKSR